MANESVTTKKYFWYEQGKKIKAFADKIKFDQWKGWIYLSPAIVLLLIFTVWPIFNAAVESGEWTWELYLEAAADAACELP